MFSRYRIAVTDTAQTDGAFFNGVHSREFNRLIAADAFVF